MFDSVDEMIEENDRRQSLDEDLEPEDRGEYTQESAFLSPCSIFIHYQQAEPDLPRIPAPALSYLTSKNGASGTGCIRVERLFSQCKLFFRRMQHHY